MIKKHLVAVPYWISDRLSVLSTTDAQAGLSLLLDYSKMRKFFSLEDLASLLSCQQSKIVCSLLAGSNNTLNHLHSSWCQSAQGSDKNELFHSVEPLSRSGETTDDLIGRLSAEYAEHKLAYDLVNSNAQNNDFFEVIDLCEDTIVVILKAGCFTAAHQGDNKLKLYRSILKVSYVYHDVHIVSHTSLFENYMDVLANKVAHV